MKKKTKLNYRFHNPNTAAVTADYILKIFLEADTAKVEKALQAATPQLQKEEPSPHDNEKRPA